MFGREDGVMSGKVSYYLDELVLGTTLLGLTYVYLEDPPKPCVRLLIPIR